MTEQQPPMSPDEGEELAEVNGFADEARRSGTDGAGAAESATEPPDEASSPA